VCRISRCAPSAPPMRKAPSSSATHATTRRRSRGEIAAVVLVLDDPDCAVATNGALIYLGTVLGEDAAVPACRGDSTDCERRRGRRHVHERDGREQRYYQAKPAPGMAQPAAWVLGQLVTTLGLAAVS